jgi:hypothetical protein
MKVAAKQFRILPEQSTLQVISKHTHTAYSMSYKIAHYPPPPKSSYITYHNTKYYNRSVPKNTHKNDLIRLLSRGGTI